MACAGSSPRARGTLNSSVSSCLDMRFIPAGAGNTRADTRMAIRQAVHPRGCGEHSLSFSVANSATGSSPRVRGTLPLRSTIERINRFIPAGAGNTFLRYIVEPLQSVHPRGCGEHHRPAKRPAFKAGSSPRVRGTRRRLARQPGELPVHPRGCGEHTLGGSGGLLEGGSSPRVRGTREIDAVDPGHHRFIPAGAGNTAQAIFTMSQPSVHPRGCGEHFIAARLFFSVLRFIPAGAGNTLLIIPKTHCYSVHPRGCGEHQNQAAGGAVSSGSSPRVRGTRYRIGRQSSFYRFIPAGAGNTSEREKPNIATAVHPRGCGEHCRIASSASCVAGSSPRARGTHLLRSQQPVRRRFIPAGAGNTPLALWRGHMGAVHPRGCGEHCHRAQKAQNRIGSSPRVRGTRCGAPPAHGPSRFIPAGAGNTIWPIWRTWMRSVHPRGCGEHLDVFGTGMWLFGSSPRVRGTPAGVASRLYMCRFIPAGAGNTEPAPAFTLTNPVHPRGCGEHNRAIVPDPRQSGSSPRVRGTLDQHQQYSSRPRFIPAGAGNTWPYPPSAVPPAVHPRGCGEHNGFFDCLGKLLGSSPRVRGTRPPSAGAFPESRFIPAGAGNTQQASHRLRCRAVHPRGCGEHVVVVLQMSKKAGSSPRVRGTPPVCGDAPTPARFIPAGAGNTG